MKEHPIIFNGEMVRAILAGRKIQSRRVVKPQPVIYGGEWVYPPDGRRSATTCYWPQTMRSVSSGIDILSPYGELGDKMWVREAFYVQPSLWSQNHDPQPIHYAASVKPEQVEDYTKKPSIHMPRWASRITLQVTSVRVERVQEISEENAIAEGVDYIPSAPAALDHRTAFAGLWDRINAKRGYGWDVNPWVWVVGFAVDSIGALSISHGETTPDQARYLHRLGQAPS